MTSAPAPYDFDIAISFAGEDRALASQVAEALKAAGVRVFYDQDYQSGMWGADLVEYFDQIYRLKSRYALLFVSQSYASKMWTRHERRSALARGLEQEEVYVLPVRLDDTNLPGLQPTVGYLDARQVGAAGIINAVLAKLGSRPGPSLPTISHVPRTTVEEQRLLRERPPGWEYLYFAGRLLHERNLLEHRYLDHETGYAALSGDIASRESMPAYIRRATGDAQELMGSLMRLMEPAIQERAFGAPGTPGDPDRIHHLANRWTATYEGILNWSARLRGASVPSDYRRALAILAGAMNEPVQQYRAFIDQFVWHCDEIPAAIGAGRPLEIVLTLTLTINDEVMKEFSREIRRIGRKK
ncbi:MAG: TIR domain-containing protein [Actinomycetota bacterium]|nr:TIR domain-containing protein [Actinomycetota bacterium]MDQ2957851.1 TIR domain-containing protein [Actinomycetota bacterium]